MKLVTIDWIDSHGSGNWQTKEDLETDCHAYRCRTVGWLVKQDKAYVVIASNILDLDHKDMKDYRFRGGNSMSIPKKCITKMMTLLEKRGGR